MLLLLIVPGDWLTSFKKKTILSYATVLKITFIEIRFTKNMLMSVLLAVDSV